MGIWNFIKTIFGHGEQKGEYPYGVPFSYAPRTSGSGDHWSKRKREFDDQMDWARTKRSRYG